MTREDLQGEFLYHGKTDLQCVVVFRRFIAKRLKTLQMIMQPTLSLELCFLHGKLHASLREATLSKAKGFMEYFFSSHYHTPRESLPLSDILIPDYGISVPCVHTCTSMKRSSGSSLIFF
jgi:hypothetical protein